MCKSNMAELKVNSSNGLNGGRIYHGLIRKKKNNWHRCQYRIVALLEATKRHIETHSKDWSRSITSDTKQDVTQKMHDKDVDVIVDMDSFFSKLKSGQKEP